MKRKFAILLSILSLICVLSACKNADDAHTDSAQRQRYDTAMNLWTSGQQYEAVKLLAENPAYEDSWDYIKEFYQTVGERIKVSSDRTVGLRSNGTVLDSKSNFAVSKWREIIQIASGIDFAAGLTNDGRVAFLEEDFWSNDVISSGYIAGWSNIKSITSNGNVGIVGLTKNGSVLMEGRSDLGCYDLSQLSGAISVLDSGEILVGLMPNGTIAITGNTHGRDYLDASKWTDIKEVSVHGNNIVGLKKDGTVLTELHFASSSQKAPDWADIVSVCATGNGGIVGLKSDGTVVTAGGIWDLSDWTNIVTIAATSEEIVALRADGTVLAKGYPPNELDEILKWTDIVAVAPSAGHLVGLKLDGTLMAIGDNEFGQCNLSTWKLFDNVNEIFAPHLYFSDLSQDDPATPEYDSPTSNFEYEIDKSGTAEITGYITNAENLKIPSEIDGHPVTALSDLSFTKCTNLVSVEIPEGIRTIGDYAFSECKNLSSIAIPDSVVSIGAYAFEECSNLMFFDLPDGLQEIGEGAFSGCSELATVTIPAGVERIEKLTFKGCSSLSNVIIPDSVTYLGESTFEGCINLPSVALPSSIIDIEGCTFLGCTSLSDIIIPDNVTYIDSGAFSDCSSLSSITIPTNITHIGDGAFRGCTSLTDVHISDYAGEWMGIYIFSGCSNLKKLHIGTPKIYFDLYSHQAFGGCENLSVICNGIQYTWDSEMIMRDSNGNELSYDSESNEDIPSETIDEEDLWEIFMS